ncbi:MAG: peptidoglycan DD-metalloendopeptidase family protein [Polyangiaceae bacterium]|nr:peptidoglycan DD-metalloendopeptidase family protein [Polyangiaceae bacterium]
MATSEAATGPRFVGSVVDPGVIDGGATEPEVHFGSAGGPVGAEAAPSAPPALEGPPPLDSPPSASSVDEARLTTDSEPHGEDNGGDQPIAAVLDRDAPLAQRGTSDLSTAPPAATVDAPVVEASGDAAVVAKDGFPPWSTEARPAPPRGQEMRARLLERARAVHGTDTAPGHVPPTVTGLDEMDPAGAPPASARDLELVRLGRSDPRTGLAPLGLGRPGALSPNMIAVVGTLLGLAAVASIVALAMNLDRRLSSGSSSNLASASAAKATAPSSSSARAPVAHRRERRPIPGPWRATDDRDKPGLRLVRGTIGRQAFLTAVQGAGVKRSESYRLPKAFEGVRDLDKCGRGDTFIALIERASGRVKAFEYIVSPEEVYQARENAEGLLRAAPLDLKVARDSFQGAFIVNGPLDTSASSAGFEPGLRNVLAKALAGHLDIDEVGNGDRMRVIAQEVTVLGAFSRYSGVEAVEIVPQDPKRPRRRFYYFKGATERGYYDAKGRSPFEGGWRNPVPGAPVTSHFNPNRLHPVLKKRMPHNGTDFGAPAGTPVHASSFGRIAFAGWGGPAGNMIRIEHPDKVETLYFHLLRFEPGIKVGDHVDRMQVIGYVGSTGRSTGPHLHFGVKRNGKYVDPLSLNLDALRVVAPEERAAFAVTVERYDTLLEAIPLPDPPPAPTLVAAASSNPVDAVGEGEEEEGREPEPTDGASVASAPSEATASSATSPAAAVFLTDKELLELQGASSDGEVAE